MTTPAQGNKARGPSVATSRLESLKRYEVEKALVDFLMDRDVKERRATDASLAYYEILDTWKYFNKRQLLQDQKPFNSNDPHAVLGPSFFRSNAAFLGKNNLSRWKPKRFEAAVRVLREHGLICTQVRGVSNASLGGKARHWWVPQPEHRAWAAAYNADIDNANLRRYQRGRNAMQAVATCTTNNGQNRGKSQSGTQGVLPKKEHRSSQNGSIGSPKSGDQGLPKQGLPKEDYQTNKSSHARRDEHFIGGKRNEDEQQNSPPDALATLLTPKAADTSFAVSYDPPELSQSTLNCFERAKQYLDEFECDNGNPDGYLRRVDVERLLARARYLLNPHHGDESQWTEEEMQQAVADALSFHRAGYSGKGRTFRCTYALLKKALSKKGAIYEPIAGQSSDPEVTPTLMWDSDINDFIAMAESYVDEAFPSIHYSDLATV